MCELPAEQPIFARSLLCVGSGRRKSVDDVVHRENVSSPVKYYVCAQSLESGHLYLLIFGVGMISLVALEKVRLYDLPAVSSPSGSIHRLMIDIG